MAISNEWQAIDGLNKITIRDNNDEINLTIYDQESVAKIASAIGWETVRLSDYSQTLTIGGTQNPPLTSTFLSENVYLIRPTDDDTYGNALLPLCYASNTSGYVNGACGIVSLSDGMNNEWVQLGYNPNYIMVLRPTAGGCFAVRFVGGNNRFTVVFDKFENPKNGSVKWGMLTDSYYIYKIGNVNVGRFENIYTREIINPTASSGSNYNTFTPNANFYPYVMLKKFTAISTAGIAIARTFYCSIIDYATAERTIEIEGDQYRCLGFSVAPYIYIPLA